MYTNQGFRKTTFYLSLNSLDNSNFNKSVEFTDKLTSYQVISN